MRFTTFTNKGTKDNNTDAVARFIDGNVCAFVVVDGGEFCGDIAAPIIMDAIKAKLRDNMQVSGVVIRDCLRAASDAIKQKTVEDSGFKNVKASCAMLVTNEKKAVWGHIGNCRIYRLSNGKIKEVTDDHTSAYKEFSEKKISFDEIAKKDVWPPLVSINSDNDVDGDVSKIKNLFFKHSFILCTDGFWKNLSGEDIEKSAKLYDNTKLSLCRMIDAIEGRAITQCDSVSAIIVNV